MCRLLCNSPGHCTEQARQSQQHYPRQVSGNMAPMQPAPVHHQRYTTGYVMSNHGSMVNSVAPSARNSPPMQPMQARLAVPGFMPQEPARQYVHVDNGYARMSWPTPVQPQVRLCWSRVPFRVESKRDLLLAHHFTAPSLPHIDAMSWSFLSHPNAEYPFALRTPL